MVKNIELLELLEDNGFTYYYNGDDIELISQTNAGVEMIIHLDNTDLYFELIDYIKEFNSEYEVLGYIYDPLYMRDIGIRKGLKDFDEYKKKLDDILMQIENLTE